MPRVANSLSNVHAGTRFSILRVSELAQKTRVASLSKRVNAVNTAAKPIIHNMRKTTTGSISLTLVRVSKLKPSWPCSKKHSPPTLEGARFSLTHTHTPTPTHTRTHARTHARTQARFVNQRAGIAQSLERSCFESIGAIAKHLASVAGKNGASNL